MIRDDHTRDLSSDAAAARAVTQPTPAARAAIRTFIETGAWPKPGVLPVRIRLGR